MLPPVRSGEGETRWEEGWIFFFLVVPGLRCCMCGLSLIGQGGSYSLLRLARASHCADFSCCGALDLGHVGSVVATRGP